MCEADLPYILDRLIMSQRNQELARLERNINFAVRAMGERNESKCILKNAWYTSLGFSVDIVFTCKEILVLMGTVLNWRVNVTQC